MGTLTALLDNSEELAISFSSAMERPDCRSLGLADAAQLALCTGPTVLLSDYGPLCRSAEADMLTALFFRGEKFRRRRTLA